MLRYIVKRLGWTLVVLWAIATLTFAATFLSPIDPARSYAGPRATTLQVTQVRHRFGLDRPLYFQYARYLGRVVSGDLGTSYEFGVSVRKAIAQALPKTALLAAGGLLVELLIGLPLGLVAALTEVGWSAGCSSCSRYLGSSSRRLLLGFLLLYVLAFKLGWFPLGEAARSLR